MQLDKISMGPVNEYIDSNWSKCVRENREDKDTLIGLPYPYSIPAVGHFEELYYWDTYFLNLGLKCSGQFEQMKFNVDNMLYLVEKYGFMPNANRTYQLKKSQPPFLSEMVREVYEHYKDRCWLRGAYLALKKEYDFWQTKRTTTIGLAQYSEACSEDEIERLEKGYVERLQFHPERDSKALAREYRTCCESGWDLNPRWEFQGESFAHLDLNALLFQVENNMAYFSEVLSNDEANVWKKRAQKRNDLMQRYMVDDRGIYWDYNFNEDAFGKVYSVAAYYPMYVGLATKEQAQAAVDMLPKLEEAYGVATCEKNSVKGNFQWNYPNGWACLQYIMVIALDRYGFYEEARRIAGKYIHLVEQVFEETGNLWEKYNVVEGNANVITEEKMPPMMGWTAGVYLAFAEHYATAGPNIH